MTEMKKKGKSNPKNKLIRFAEFWLKNVFILKVLDYIACSFC